MAKKKPDFNKDVKEDLKRELYQSIKDISNVSRSAIAEFYNSYQPKEYQRVYGLKDLFNIHIKHTQRGYCVTYRYSASLVQRKEHHESYSEAFASAFIRGEHGGYYAWGKPKKYIPKMSKSPWNMILDYVQAYYI